MNVNFISSSLYGSRSCVLLISHIEIQHIVCVWTCDVLWIGSFHIYVSLNVIQNVIFIILLHFLNRYSNFGNLRELTVQQTDIQSIWSGLINVNVHKFYRTSNLLLKRALFVLLNQPISFTTRFCCHVTCLDYAMVVYPLHIHNVTEWFWVEFIPRDCEANSLSSYLSWSLTWVLW